MRALLLTMVVVGFANVAHAETLLPDGDLDRITAGFSVFDLVPTLSFPSQAPTPLYAKIAPDPGEQTVPGSAPTQAPGYYDPWSFMPNAWGLNRLTPRGAIECDSPGGQG